MSHVTEVTVMSRPRLQRCAMQAYPDTQHTHHDATINHHPTRFLHMHQKSEKSSLAMYRFFLEHIYKISTNNMTTTSDCTFSVFSPFVLPLNLFSLCVTPLT